MSTHFTPRKLVAVGTTFTKAKRGDVVHTSYEASVLNEMDATGVTRTMAGATLRVLQGGVYDWHQEVGDGLARHYSVNGYSSSLLRTDWALLRKTCGATHPSELTYFDLEEVVLAYREANAADSTIDWFINRMRSIYKVLRLIEIVDQSCTPEKGLKIKPIPRGEPRPLTRAQAQMLMTQSDLPYREWFMFGCLAGLRAMEIANICGSWLEEGEPGEDGQSIWLLRVFGKGHTEKTIPCHPALRELIQSKKTLGRLYAIQPHYLSKKANEEMRRMGIITKNYNQKATNSSRISFHSARHYFATALLAASNDIALVSKAMRHTDPRVTMIYAGLNPVRSAQFVGSLFQSIDFTANPSQNLPSEMEK
jgi:integrase